METIAASSSTVLLQQLIEAINNQARMTQEQIRMQQDNTAVTRDLIAKVSGLDNRMEVVVKGIEKVAVVEERVLDLERALLQDESFEKGRQASRLEMKSETLGTAFSSNPWLIGLAMVLVAALAAFGLFIAPKEIINRAPVPRIETQTPRMEGR